MKNTLVTAVYVILVMAVVYVSLFFLSCSKKGISNSDQHQANFCSATKMAVENSEISPSDNRGTKNISQ